MAQMIETERLILRNWRDADLEPWIAMNQDSEVMRYFPKTLTAEESTSMYERTLTFLNAHDYGLWAVEVKNRDPFIGFVGLNHQSMALPFMPCVEIGWRLDKSAWGQGYATEGAIKILSFGLEDLYIPEIFSFTSTSNTPSIKVMERIGLHHRADLDFLHPKIEEGNPLREHVVYSS